MSIKKSGSSGASKPPSSPKPASKPSTSKPSTTGASKPATSSASSTAKSTSSSSSSSSSKSSSTSDSKASSTSEAEKKKSSSSSEVDSSKDVDKDKLDTDKSSESSSSDKPDDKFEKSRELKEKDEKKTEGEKFNDKLISNIRNSFEDNPSTVDKELGKVEESLEIGKVSDAEAYHSIEQLESRIAGLSGDKKDKLQNRTEELKNNLESDEKAANQEAEAQHQDRGLQEAKGVDTEETQQQRREKLERAELEAQKQLAAYREQGDTAALGGMERAYMTAQLDRDQTLKTLEGELSKVYPADQAKELAAKSLESKDGFMSRFSSLHKMGNEESRKRLEKLNPAAAELAGRDVKPETKEVSPGDINVVKEAGVEKDAQKTPEDKELSKARGEKTDETPQERRSQLEKAEEETHKQLAEMARDGESLGKVERAFETAQLDKVKTLQTLEGELSKVYPAEQAKELAQKSLENKDGFFSRFSSLHKVGDAESKARLEKMNPSAAELVQREQNQAEKAKATAPGISESAGARDKKEIEELGKPGAGKADLSPRAEKAAASGALREETSRGLGETDSEIPAEGAKVEPAARPDTQEFVQKLSEAYGIEQPEAVGESASEARDPKRELWAAEDAAHQRIQDYKREGNTEALQEMDRAFAVAQTNRGDTFKTFSEQLGKVHTTERAQELARHAIGSKDAFYTRYGSLYETGDLQAKRDLAKINPTAAKMTQKELAAQRRKELLDSRESKAVEEKAQTAVTGSEPPRAEKVKPAAEAGKTAGGLRERAQQDPEAFKTDLKEAFPNAKPEELDKLYQQALKGEDLGEIGGRPAAEMLAPAKAVQTGEEAPRGIEAAEVVAGVDKVEALDKKANLEGASSAEGLDNAEKSAAKTAEELKKEESAAANSVTAGVEAPRGVEETDVKAEGADKVDAAEALDEKQTLAKVEAKTSEQLKKEELAGVQAAEAGAETPRGVSSPAPAA